jgi:hypothetical protein
MAEKVLLEWHFSKYLLVTSFLLLLPAWFAYSKQLYLFSAIIGISSLISINYWRHSTFSYRRYLDFIVQTVCIVLVIVLLLYYDYHYYAIDDPYVFVNIFTILTAIFCYYKSWSVWLENTKSDWWKYHLIFHILVIVELILQIRLIEKSNI